MAETHHVNYRKIYITLLVLLVISVAGPFLGIKWVTILSAFGIAFVKANLVIQNFMHLKWEKRIAKYVLLASVALLLLFYYGIAPDVQKHTGQNWSNDAALAATARGIPDPHAPAAGHGDEPAARHEPDSARAGDTAHDSAAAPAASFNPRVAYTTNCSPCHGAGGRGDGAVAASLNPRPADFTDPAFWRSRTDAHVFKVIREGGAAAGRSASMPACSSLLDSAQTTAMIAYLKSLRRPS
jgi:caa(3)-type oxidase subunit IV